MSSSVRVVGAILMFATGCGNVATPRSVACGAQVLPNGNFDAAAPAWVQVPATPALLCGMSTITPVSAPQVACLGGIDGSVQTLSQTIALPEGVKKLTLSGMICVTTQETEKVDHDLLEFDVLDGSDVIASLGKFTNQDGAAQCAFMAFPDKTATASSDPVNAALRIRSTLNASTTGTTVTSFFIDNLTLTASCTP